MEYNRDLNVGDIVYLNMTYEKYKHLLGAYATVISTPITQQRDNSDRFNVIYYDTADRQCKQINVARFDIIAPAMHCTFQKGDIVKYVGATDNQSGCMCSDATIIDFTTYGPSQMSNEMYDIKIKNNKPYHDYIKYNVAPSKLILVSRKNKATSKQQEKVNKEMTPKYKVGDHVIYKPTHIDDCFFKDQEAKILNCVEDIKDIKAQLYDIQFASPNEHRGVIKYNVSPSNLIPIDKKNIPISKQQEKVNKEIMSKYKVGDKVIVRNDLECGKWYGAFPLYGNMAAYMGKTIEITQVLDTNRYQADNNVWDWTDEMIEGLAENNIKSAYKVGDKVLIMKDLVQYQRYGQLQCVGGMLRCCGFTMEITQVDEVKNSSNSIIDYVYMLDNSPYKWCKEMFEERIDCSEQSITDTDFLI